MKFLHRDFAEIGDKGDKVGKICQKPKPFKNNDLGKWILTFDEKGDKVTSFPVGGQIKNFFVFGKWMQIFFLFWIDGETLSPCHLVTLSPQWRILGSKSW